MPTVTLSVTEDLKGKMDQFDYINWSAVAREAIKERIEQLSALKKIVSKSKLTEADVEELGRKISEGMHEKYKKLYPGLK
ncbi:MAG: hypothetical protein V1735_00280 [Nanoarchaeota archaeon]